MLVEIKKNNLSENNNLPEKEFKQISRSIRVEFFCKASKICFDSSSPITLASRANIQDKKIKNLKEMKEKWINTNKKTGIEVIDLSSKSLQCILLQNHQYRILLVKITIRKVFSLRISKQKKIFDSVTVV